MIWKINYQKNPTCLQHFRRQKKKKPTKVKDVIQMHTELQNKYTPQHPVIYIEISSC